MRLGGTMTTTTTLKYVRHDPLAKPPTRGSKRAAGWDLYSIEHCIINPGSQKTIQTGVWIDIPPGCYGRIAPRSGLAVRHGIHVGGGVIDPDFMAPVAVIFFNFGREPFEVNIHDKIAQVIMERCVMVDSIQEVPLHEMPHTERGNNGFGSTGLK